MAELNVVGATEVAELCGVGRVTVSRWPNPNAPGFNPNFPQPDAILACGPVWLEATIRDFMTEFGYPKRSSHEDSG